MKYITAICYNVKKCPFQKVTYLANPFDDVREAVAWSKEQESIFSKDKNSSKVRAHTFELGQQSYDLVNH